MNSLEFINNEIETTKREIDFTNIELERTDTIIRKNLDKLKRLKERLQTLQQIKTELEAWEVVKRKGFIFTKEEKNQLIGNTWNIYRLSSRELNNKEYEIIKKALEVKDEDRE